MCFFSPFFQHGFLCILFSGIVGAGRLKKKHLMTMPSFPSFFSFLSSIKTPRDTSITKLQQRVGRSVFGSRFGAPTALLELELIPADCSPVGCGSTHPAVMEVGSNQEEPLLRNGNDPRELLLRSLSLFHVCFSPPLTQQKSCLSSASFSKGSPMDRVSRREI